MFSLADATVSPVLNVSISGNSDITADGGIALKALHNRNADGSEITGNQAKTHASAPGGALIGGNGADATSVANASLDAYVASTVTLESIDGIIQILALAYNDAYAESDGVIGGGVAIGASLADATANGSTNHSLNSTEDSEDIDDTDTIRVEFDPVSNVNSSTDTLTFSTNHGLTNGQKIVYYGAGGQSVGGLVDGHTYYVIVTGAKTLKLSTTSGGSAINLTALDAEDVIRRYEGAYGRKRHQRRLPVCRCRCRQLRQSGCQRRCGRDPGRRGRFSIRGKFPDCFHFHWRFSYHLYLE